MKRTVGHARVEAARAPTAPHIALDLVERVPRESLHGLSPSSRPLA